MSSHLAILRAVLSAAAALAWTATAGAQCLVDIGTGYDEAAGAVLAAGSLDDDYTVDGGGGPAAAFTGGPAQGFPVPPWVENDEASLWISPTVNSLAAPGTYTFEIRFEVPDDAPAGLVTLEGRLTADDQLTNLIVNETPTGFQASGFNAWTSLPSGFGQGLFRNGENVLKFVVSNGGDAPNPCGLRVQACATVPEARARPYDLSTGFDRSVPSVLPNGAPDTAYVLTGPEGSGIGPGPAVVVNDDAFPIPPWLGTSVQSKWIGPAPDSNGPPGIYRYAISIDLPPEVDAEFASIGGGFAADDAVRDVIVNGVSTGVSGAGFGALTAFPAAAGRGLFATGANVVEFLVENGGDAPGPTGLRVDAVVLTCPAAEPPAVSPSDFFIDTGFDQAAGALIGNGLPDDNYQLVLPPGSETCRIAAAVVNDNAFPIPPWIASTAQSKWIGPAADSNGSGGLFAYRIRVDVPEGIDASALRLLGSWTSDNAGIGIFVNGVSTGVAGDGNFTVFAPFPASAGLGLFRTGENVIEFRVENAGAGPTGLRVEGVVGQGTRPGDLSTGIGVRNIGPVGVGSAEGRYAAQDPDSNPVALQVLAPAPGWIENAPASKWIGPASPGSALAYTLAFDLGGEVNPNRVALEGGFASAPAGAAALLNGQPLGLSSGDPASLTAFPVGAGTGLFVQGTNVLSFALAAPEAGVPSGLRVDARWVQAAAANPLDISTGFDEVSGSVLAPGELDPGYVMVLPDASEAAATVVAGAPIPPWAANTVSSAWIGSAEAGGNGEPGEYRFRTTVALAAGEAERAYLSGGSTADDGVNDVLVNGQSTGFASQSGFGALTMFPADFGLGLFREGENTIEFVVSNAGAAANPFGLRVDAVVALKAPAGGSQRPGDCNQDNKLDISDGVCLLGYLFLGQPAELPCEGGTADDEGNRLLVDSNGDAKVDLSDAVRVFGYLFLGDPPPALGTECVAIPGCPEVCR